MINFLLSDVRLSNLSYLSLIFLLDKGKNMKLLFLLLLTINLSAQFPFNLDPSLRHASSPYFLILNDSSKSDTEQLPLKSTSAGVRIIGSIANVTLTQVFQNRGKVTIEAVYVFPSSLTAAVYAMEMKIGERVIKAEIDTKDHARKIYEKAKGEGKSASLLEQSRPNVFTMNVANVLPGDIIEVSLSYTELLIPTDKVYEFVLPTVVGPRFVSPNQDKSGEGFTETPYLKEGVESSYDFDVKLSISSGIEVSEADCKSHDMDILLDDDHIIEAKLKDGQEKSGNKDFIFTYKLVGDNIQTGLMMQEGEHENHFLLMIQPPKRVEKEELPPREYVFILDVSGSMRGFPLTVAKRTLVKLTKELKPTDKFNVMLFSGGSELFEENSVYANYANLSRAIKFIDDFESGGGTELLPALRKALEMKASSELSRSFLILTDGYVSVEDEAIDLIKENIGKANIFAFGIGSSINRHLIEAMARAGQGMAFYVTKLNQAAEVTGKFVNYVKSPVMTNISYKFDGFSAYDVYPKHLPDLLSDRPLIIYGKYRRGKKGDIIVTGLAEKKYTARLPVKVFGRKSSGKTLGLLWARKQLEDLSDYAGSKKIENKSKIEEIGLKYNLLTEYTSFLAVDYKKRSDGKYEKVKQPLPLPDGVSDDAVGLGGMMSRGMKNMGSALQTLSGGGFSNYSGGISYELNEKKDAGLDKYREKQRKKDAIYLSDYDTPPTWYARELTSKVIYPIKMKKIEREDTIRINVFFDEKGNPIRYSNYDGYPYEFIRSAWKAIKGTKFTPAQKNGKAVKSQLEIEVEFKLKEGFSSIGPLSRSVRLRERKNGLKVNIDGAIFKDTLRIGDEVELEIVLFNQALFRLNYKKINIIVGIGEIDSYIDDMLLESGKFGRRHFMIPRYLLEFKAYDAEFIKKSQGDVIFKITWKKLE